MITTGDDLRHARERLGWSLSQLADALRMQGEADACTRLRKMEAGRRPITGPISVAVEAFSDGFRPEGFREPKHSAFIREHS